MELAEEFETDPNLGVPVHSLKIRKPTLWLHAAQCKCYPAPRRSHRGVEVLE